MTKAGKNFYGYNTYSNSKATQADKLGTSFTSWIKRSGFERVTLISVNK